MPLQSQLHVDKLLSNVSVKYRNADFIAMKIFPEVPVRSSSDKFRIYDRDFRLPDTKRANKGVANQYYWEASTATYILDKHAIKDYISDEDVVNFEPSDLRADTVEELSDIILRRLEKNVADLFTTTSWSLNVSLAAAAAWTADTTVSNPIPVMDTGATEVIQNSGLRPNFAVVSRTGFVGAKNHQSVLDRLKYTSAEVTQNMMAGLFDVQELHVPIASYDSAAKGNTSVITSIWGDVAFIGYKPSRPSPKAPSCGYIFRRAKDMVRRWRDDERDAEAIEVQMDFQARVVASLSGFLVKDIE
jgi:hypothetical protein